MCGRLRRSGGRGGRICRRRGLGVREEEERGGGGGEWRGMWRDWPLKESKTLERGLKKKKGVVVITERSVKCKAKNKEHGWWVKGLVGGP
ncbi:unnamed protein product [Eruca vesicaria subsp. sativa]|uniref:Uncharacterized protein n=1 Tax=Eruca vesicaria subsp. sativa TaxID=29727 RepID=A0ABC8JW52_ERUVS|nr:unnamed protein product [Eruca vesicaria subsp. sativa]